jgi:hypothetical protein
MEVENCGDMARAWSRAISASSARPSWPSASNFKIKTIGSSNSDKLPADGYRRSLKQMIVFCEPDIFEGIAAMSEDPSYLRLGFVIAVLGMAGISYWVVQERSQSTALTKNVAEAPAPAMQKPAQNPLPASESSVPDAGASLAAVVENRVPPPEPPAREEKPLDKPTAASPTETPNLQEGPTTESASATTAGQSEEPAAPPLSPPRDIFSQPTQATAPAPPSSTALAAAIPGEDKMNARNRRQVQQALQRLGYYEGPLDELFGPATRSAIRRFQESIGAQATGRLNETEASRLASGP